MNTRSSSLSPGTWLLAVLALILVADTSAPSAQSRPRGVREAITIAVVRDGPATDRDLVGEIREELEGLLPRTEVTFKEDPAFVDGWNADGTAAALRRLPKPVISTFVQLADVYRLQYTDDGRAVKENLSFMVIPRRAERDVEAFRALVHFETLHVAVGEEELERFGDLGVIFAGERLGVRFELVPVTEDVDAFLARMNSSIQGVYLTGMPRLSASKRRRLIDGLTNRGIPAYSMVGHPDVRLGALAALTPDTRAQAVRRVALNLSDLARGMPTADLPVFLQVDTRLLINGETAAAVGYHPDQETLIYAEFLHAGSLEADAESLTLGDTFARAEAGNTELKIVDADVEGDRQVQFQNRSGLLPQFFGDLSAAHSDTNVSDPISFPAARLSLSQQIYDDSAWSAYKSSRRRFEGSELDREANRLDVLQGSGFAFYDLALAQALYRVHAENLQLTEDNLELARLRLEVGYSGREEILRWESNLAEVRAGLFRAVQDIETTRISLNQLLGIDQERRWLPEAEQIDADVFPFVDGRLAPLFDDSELRPKLREVLVDAALVNSPDVLAVAKDIEAEDIRYRELKRRYFVPRVVLEVQYQQRLSGTANNALFLADDSFLAYVAARYPIIVGGQRKADARRARADLDGFEQERTLFEQLVEKDTRTAIRRVENSFPRIKLARHAAATATEYLDLVQEQYIQGFVDVTNLIDAQNNKLTTDQFAQAIVFEFLADLLALQRAISWFEEEQTPAERDRFVEEVTSAVLSR